MAELKALRQIDGFVTKDEAETAMFDYAAKLVERGVVDRFTVCVKPIYEGNRKFPTGWGVYLRDHAIPAPARARRSRAS